MSSSSLQVSSPQEESYGAVEGGTKKKIFQQSEEVSSERRQRSRETHVDAIASEE